MANTHLTSWLLDLFNDLPAVDPLVAISISAVLSITLLTFDFFKNKK